MNHPLPILAGGRSPVVTQEFKPGKHLGCDLMYHGREGDPTGPPRAVRRGERWYVVPEGVKVRGIAVGGFVIYARERPNGWRTRVRYRTPEEIRHLVPYEEFHWLDLHMERLCVQSGQILLARPDVVGRAVAEDLGVVGGDPTDLPHRLRHDHVELRIPLARNVAGERDYWAMVPVDPEPLLRYLLELEELARTTTVS